MKGTAKYSSIHPISPPLPRSHWCIDLSFFGGQGVKRDFTCRPLLRSPHYYFSTMNATTPLSRAFLISKEGIGFIWFSNEVMASLLTVHAWSCFELAEKAGRGGGGERCGTWDFDDRQKRERMRRGNNRRCDDERCQMQLLVTFFTFIAYE